MFDRAMAAFAVAYADQNERDHQALQDRRGERAARRDDRDLTAPRPGRSPAAGAVP